MIQAALNLVQSARFKLKKALLVDGKMGSKSIVAIEDFQKNIVKLTSPDGRVDAGGTTLKFLKQNITKGLNLDSLTAIMAMGSRSNINVYLNLMNTAFPKYQINTPLRKSHFLA